MVEEPMLEKKLACFLILVDRFASNVSQVGDHPFLHARTHHLLWQGVRKEEHFATASWIADSKVTSYLTITSNFLLAGAHAVAPC